MRRGAALAMLLAAVIVPAGAHASFPGPNGKIVFVSDRDGNFEIYSMNPDGSAQTRLTNNPARDEKPAVSPDGSRIAFQSERAGAGSPDIWVMNADGSSQTRVTTTGYGLDPAFMPNGRILFAGPGGGDFEIFSINQNGSGKTQLTQNSGLHEYNPAASPSGLKIAFDQEGAGTGLDIYSMNANGTGVVNLTNSPPIDTGANWSPDGSKIAFTTSRVGNAEVFSMNANGSSPLNLTADAGGDSTPAYAPTGSRIAFTSTRGGSTDVWAMNANGTNQFPLTTSAASDFDPDWAPATVTCAVPGGITDATDANPGNGIVEGTAGYDLLRGGPGSETLDGKGGSDVLCGEGGNDTLIGGPGATAGADADLLDGGPGNDTASYTARTTGVFAAIGDGQNDGASEGDNILSSVESVLGGSAADFLVGDAAANYLAGNGGADLLAGGGGADWLNGGPGTAPDGDNIQGGPGADYVDYASRTAGVVVELDPAGDAAAVEGQAGEGDSVKSDIEYVLTGSGNDDVRGNAAANYLVTGAGADTIVGRLGSDYIDAGAGDDANIDVLDGVVDWVVCGTGADPFSTTEFDEVDVLAADCERT